MKVAILHISDIHFTQKENPVSERVINIARACQSIGNEVETCLVAVTGDIASSGEASQ